MTPGRDPAQRRSRLRCGHVAAVTAAHCSAAFAALGLPPFLPQLLPELGDPHARWAGVLYVLPTLCTAIAAPLWGRLADRYGRRALLVRAQLGLAVAFTLAAVAGNLPMLAAALAAQGLLGGTFAASAAYLASGLRGEPLAKALALMQGSARVALAAAPVLAGLLAADLSVRQMYGLAALLPLAAAIGTLLLPEPTGATGRTVADTPATPATPATPDDLTGQAGIAGAVDADPTCCVGAGGPGGPAVPAGAAEAGRSACGARLAGRPPLAEPAGATRTAGPAGPPGRITVRGLAISEAGFVLATVVTFPYFLPLVADLAPGLPPAAGGLLFALPHLCYLLAAAPALRLFRTRARAGLAAGFGLAAVSALVHLAPALGAPGAPAWLVAGRLLLGAALTCGLTALSLLAAEAATGRPPGRLFGVVEAWSKGGAVVAGVTASALAVLGPAAPLAAAVAAGALCAAVTARVTTPRSDDKIRS